MSQSKTYKELAESWGVDKQHLYQAKAANAENLEEGTHYTLGSKGEYLWTPDGQAVLAESLKLDVQIEFETQQNIEPELQDAPDSLTLSVADEVSQALADPIALQVWHQLPQRVFASMRRMLHAPANEAESHAVGQAMNAFISSGSSLPALPNSQRGE